MKKMFFALVAALAAVTAWGADMTTTDVDIKIYEKTCYYKANVARPFYATCRFRYDDVTRVGDFDMAAYRRALVDEFNLGLAVAPEGYLYIWSLAFTNQYGEQFTEVDKPGKSYGYNEWYETHPMDDNDGYPYGSPYENASLTYQGYNPQAQVLTMLWSSSSYTGGGLGASYMSLSVPFYYDMYMCRKLMLSDLFRGNYQEILLREVRRWVADHAEEMCLTESVKDVPLSDIWELRDGEIVFVYPKYSIGCGAAGNVEVPVYAYTLEDYFLPKGRILLSVE